MHAAQTKSRLCREGALTKGASINDVWTLEGKGSHGKVDESDHTYHQKILTGGHGRTVTSLAVNPLSLIYLIEGPQGIKVRMHLCFRNSVTPFCRSGVAQNCVLLEFPLVRDDLLR